MINIYVDGACAVKSTKRGGWGWYAVIDGNEFIDSGSEEDSTNNRMELMAAIEALNAVIEPQHCHILSDSEYVIKGITLWIHKWKAKQYRKVKNNGMWRQLDEAVARHPEVTWEWVKAHSGIRGNEAANILAQHEAGTG